MPAAIFVRQLTEEELQELESGLHSPSAFTRRRCYMVLASHRGESAPQIATALGCAAWTVVTALRAFSARGVAALSRSRPRPCPPRPRKRPLDWQTVLARLPPEKHISFFLHHHTYWYAGWWDHGKVKHLYIGKEAPEHPCRERRCAHARPRPQPPKRPRGRPRKTS